MILNSIQTEYRVKEEPNQFSMRFFSFQLKPQDTQSKIDDEMFMNSKCDWTRFQTTGDFGSIIIHINY